MYYLSLSLSLALSLTVIYPQEQDLYRGSNGQVVCTLNGSNLSSTINMEVYINGVPIPQSSYRNSFPLPHRAIGLDVLTLLQPFMSIDLPSAFTLLCAAYNRSGLTVSPLQLSAESTVRIQGMSRFCCFLGKYMLALPSLQLYQMEIIKCKLRVPNHGCDP